MSCRARWPPFFSGERLVDLGEPAPAELLDGRDVDGAVVEEVLDLGQLSGQEAAVGPDGVAGQGDRAGLGDVRLEEGQGLRPGVGEGQRRRLDGGEEARAGVHGAHEVVHVGQLLRRGVDDEVGPLLDQCRSSSVTRLAISTMVWRAGSSPVISRSIQASMRGHATGRPRRREVGAGPCNVRRCCACPSSSSTRELPVARLRPRGRRRRRPDRPDRRRAACRGGRALVPTGVAVAIPNGLRRPGAAPQRAGRPPRRHLPERARADRLGLPGGAPGGAGQPRPRARLHGQPGRPDRPAGHRQGGGGDVRDGGGGGLEEAERGSGGFGHTGT